MLRHMHYSKKDKEFAIAEVRAKRETIKAEVEHIVRGLKALKDVSARAHMYPVSLILLPMPSAYPQPSLCDAPFQSAFPQPSHILHIPHSHAQGQALL